MNEDDNFDLFLAYFGNVKSGSEAEAKELYEEIEGIQIGRNRFLRCYFHPVTNPQGVFEETPLTVARTPLFLLTVNQNVPRNQFGQLSRQREDGMLRNVFEEVQTFHNSPMYKDHGGEESAKLYITDVSKFTFKEAENLHPIFSGKIAFSSPDQVKEWVRRFYRLTYPDRLYRKAQKMAYSEISTFLRGEWVIDAQKWWDISRLESLGKILLAYYGHYARDDINYRLKARQCCEELKALPAVDPKTEEVIRNVEKIIR